MTAIRLVGLDRLRERLRLLLGADSLLFRRFERALAARDAERVRAAMDALALYPPGLRAQVEEALLGWLLGDPVEPSMGRSDGLSPG
jgi:hypothetical protein